jgi:hypothetical protein
MTGRTRSFVNDCHTHSLLKLVKLADLRVALDADINSNPALGLNWDVVKDWDERSRYQRHSQAKAQKLIDAITDGANGVLPWIKARW